MQIQLRHTPAFGVARLVLAPNETVRAEAGAMMTMSSGVVLQAKAEGGVMKSLKRAALGGESFFITTYTAPADGGFVDVAPRLPGDMVVLDVDPAMALNIQKGSWIASAATVELDTKWGGFKNLFGSEGGFIVRATGTLQNPATVLTATQRARLATAIAGDTAVFIVKADEVGTAAARPAGTGALTWRFTAENVRDFAFASSKTFVWDAAGFRYRKGGRTIELHSVYPRQAMPLWNEVSTKAIAQTMKTYGRMAFEYPYPQASNVNGQVGGMEYPMIAFCGGRPGANGTYTKAQEYALASVTIHEVGHNWFPMIVATDERKWTWMDEGLNSFLEYYGSLDYDPQWPVQRLRGPSPNIVGYMKDPQQVPLMTESDFIFRQFGNNGYSKPAAGLVMLREKILGAERFDLAFQEYAKK